jgi:hypothetical protein
MNLTGAIQERLSFLFVFSLLLFMMMFCALAFAQDPQDGGACEPIGRATTVITTWAPYENDPNITIDATYTCTCVLDYDRADDPDQKGYGSWVCEAPHTNAPANIPHLLLSSEGKWPTRHLNS